ncbi:MAG: hypothetical protein M1365_05760, partial [Actinobacteria bacterium]|nr:hypothetical protein [Actinomycetota bacterium]
MIKRIILFLICFLIYANSSIYSFGYLTHIHINKEADPTLGKIFETYGVMPDSFNLENINFIYTYSGSFEYVAIADILHSPDPKEDPIASGFCPYQDKPNFGYLLLKTAESNNKLNASKGFAGHIAADWVAHKFLKIIDLESIFSLPLSRQLQQAISDLMNHGATEILIDYYIYLTKGEVELANNYYPNLIRKGLINYFLIKNHETDFVRGIFENDSIDLLQKNSAINLVDSTITYDKIKEKVIDVIKDTKYWQIGYIAFSDFIGPVENAMFIAAMSPIADPLFTAGVLSVKSYIPDLPIF